MKNPFKVVKNFLFEEENTNDGHNKSTGTIQQPSIDVPLCQACGNPIANNKPKIFKMNGQRMMICKPCFRKVKKGMGA